MTETEYPEWLKNMPKTDLHCHLGGSMRVSTILELADKYGVHLPATNEKDLRAIVSYKNRENKSLDGYLSAIKICESVLKSPEAFQRVAYEVCQDARSENVEVFELRFGPTNYVSEKMKLYEIVEATLDGIKKAAKEFNMHTGLIICGNRKDANLTRIAAEIAVNYQMQGVIGFDLAGKENGYRPHDLRDAIDTATHNFLPVTIHAGEEDNVQSISEAVADLNAARIGHAISLRESLKLVNYVDTRRTGLEICLTSNIDTGAVTSYETHPVRSYFLDNLRVTINTDNRTISDTTITKELHLLMTHLGFKQEHIFKLMKNGLKSSFLNSKQIFKELNKFDEYIEGVKHGG